MSASALLFRPRPKEQEGLMGYLLRLVDENYLTGIGELLRLTLSSPDRGYVRYAVSQALDFSASQLERLASQLGLSVDVLHCLNDPLETARALEHPVDTQSFLYRVLRRDVHRVWCPGCLQEDEFLRKAWDWILTTRCPRHECLLVERCEKCNDLVRWRTATLAACGCGFDLRRASAQKVEKGALDNSVLIADSGRLQRLLTLLLMRLGDSSGVLDIRTVRSSSTVTLDAALQTITIKDVDDPHRFRDSLFGEMSRRFSMHPEVGPRFAAAPLLNGLQVDPEFDNTLLSTAGTWLEAWKAKGERRADRASRLVSVCVDTAQATLGLSERSMKAFRKYGLLVSDETVQSAPHRSRPITVESMMRVLRWMAPSDRQIDLTDKRLVCLARLNAPLARQQWKALITPSLPWEAVAFDETVGISSLVIAVRDDAVASEVVTVKKAAEMLSTNVHVVRRAIMKGLIRCGEVKRGRLTLIPTKEVDRMKASYVFAAELAATTASSVTAVLERLRSANIEPVLTGDQRGGLPYLFCRHQVNSAIATGSFAAVSEQKPRRRYPRSPRNHEIQVRFARLM